MKYLLGKASSMFIASGLITIAAGLALCLYPVSEFGNLIYLFGVPAVLQSLVHINTAALNSDLYDTWWILFLVGIVYMAAGTVILCYPDVTPMFLMIGIAATWAFVGITMMLLSVQLNKESEHEFGLFLTGALSAMAGVFLVLDLHRTIYSVLWIAASYNFLMGMLTVRFGVRARAWRHIYFDDIME